MNETTHTPRSTDELGPLKLGDQNTDYQFQYDPNILEKIANRAPESQAWSSFICTEFTSLCPKTKQPDFAKVFINYIADESLVESKSLKLYLFSFRNHGGFHEDCIQTICNDLSTLLKPKYLEVIGEFTPRGGIAIFPYSNWANGEDKFEQIKNQRQMNYRPGLYSVDLAKLYH